MDVNQTNQRDEHVPSSVFNLGHHDPALNHIPVDFLRLYGHNINPTTGHPFGGLSFSKQAVGHQAVSNQNFGSSSRTSPENRTAYGGNLNHNNGASIHNNDGFSSSANCFMPNSFKANTNIGGPGFHAPPAPTNGAINSNIITPSISTNYSTQPNANNLSCGYTPTGLAANSQSQSQSQTGAVARGVGKSGRKDPKRSGMPKPSTYSEIEEAIIIEGLAQAVRATDEEIAQVLGRSEPDVYHKILRMRREGKAPAEDPA